MKGIIKYIALLCVAAVSFASCNFLDEFDPNRTNAGNYYQSEEDIVNSLYGAYSGLKSQEFFGKNSFLFTDVRSNATMYTSSGTNGGQYYQFYNFDLNNENGFSYDRYKAIYKTIYRANTVIQHLDDVTYGNPDARNIYEAEARFIRALCHFYLVVEWGDMPVVLSRLEDLDQVNSTNERRPKSEVYQAIFDDLNYVVGSPLQNTCPAAECGRASKAATYALAGKAYLQYACDEDLADGKANALTNAISNLTSVWNLKTFGDLSSVAFKDIWELATQKGCPENIFQLNYIAGNEDLSSEWSVYWGPATTGITSMAKGSENNFTNVNVFNLYEDKDVRKEYLRKFSYGGQEYYHTTKFTDLECGNSGLAGNNWIVFRYADVALMLAEAYYWSGDEANAKTYLNMVRKRAGLGDWAGTDLKNGIYKERILEFMHEGMSWHDMLRMNTEEEMVEMYKAINPNFSATDLLLPIPYSEYILNPEGLYQNPGY